MTWVLYVDVAVGFAFALGVLVMAILARREAPVHTVLWAIALGLLVLRALFSLSIGIGVLLASDRSWAFAIGAAALTLLVPAAVLRPRWAGIALLVTAVAQPAILFVLGRLSGLAGEEFPVEVMLGFYSVPVSIIGALLILSTIRWGRREEPADAAVSAPADQSAGADQSVGAEPQR